MMMMTLGHIDFEKCRKHLPAANVSNIFLVFSNAHCALSQCNTALDSIS